MAGVRCTGTDPFAAKRGETVPLTAQKGPNCKAKRHLLGHLWVSIYLGAVFYGSPPLKLYALNTPQVLAVRFCYPICGGIEAGVQFYSVQAKCTHFWLCEGSWCICVQDSVKPGHLKVTLPALPEAN